MMKRKIDDLDQMIDDLNANREPDNGAETGELADLVELVRGLKELGHTAWPDESFPLRTAIHLSQQLNPADAPQSGAHIEPDLDDTGETPPLPLASRDAATPTRLPRKRQSGLRIGLEIAAAAAILIAFTALIATLFGNLNGGSQPSDPDSHPSIMLASVPTAPSSVPTITDQSSVTSAPVQATSPATPDTSPPVLITNQMLEELQAQAGFDLLAPANVPDSLMLAMTAIPTPLPSFKSAVFKYQNAPGKIALTITEASPYQDSAETMPADIFNSAVPQDLGNGTTVSVYQSEADIQVWWEVGPTSIRLESDGSPGTTLLTKDQMLEIARTMVPVGKLPLRVSVPPDGKVQTADEAIVQARTLLGSIGGNAAAPVSTVGLQALSEETTLGMPQPSGSDANAPVWSVTFPNGMPPQGCPALGVSVCNASSVTVIVDAQSGNILAWRDPSGAWKQP
ncbi:MAG TPA: hypothetical protein VHV31_06420 [Nitrolancea sp.]|nr:hypothetical protein [Nitrolancea sp.]